MDANQNEQHPCCNPVPPSICLIANVFLVANIGKGTK